jgi:hypothetical protein
MFCLHVGREQFGRVGRQNFGRVAQFSAAVSERFNTGFDYVAKY